MKVVDIILALISGWVVAFIANDFFKGFGIVLNVWQWLFLHWMLPLVSLLCLWLAYLIGKKVLFVYQAAKFLLIGAIATVIDIKIFQLLFWFFSLFLTTGSLILMFKAVSFIIATLAKYWGNKHWTFGKTEKDNSGREIAQFFLVTLAGLCLDVGSFYYFTKILGTQFLMPREVWVELSIISSALIAAVCHFLGYKFLVFKK